MKRVKSREFPRLDLRRIFFLSQKFQSSNARYGRGGPFDFRLVSIVRFNSTIERTCRKMSNFCQGPCKSKLRNVISLCALPLEEIYFEIIRNNLISRHVTLFLKRKEPPSIFGRLALSAHSALFVSQLFATTAMHEEN